MTAALRKTDCDFSPVGFEKSQSYSILNFLSQPFVVRNQPEGGLG